MRVEEEETGWGGGFGAAEELAEKKAAGGEDAAMGMDEAALDAEGDVAERLPVDQEVEVVQGEGLEVLFHAFRLSLSLSLSLSLARSLYFLLALLLYGEHFVLSGV
ncbi:hypothetical protein MUK42_16899 [Musa troglodytarum]|uniref:Uncharacterized protein n=1 Tax=Musa troglodytarum TaxID=320322 RepID=A0A9E7G8C5_9LILI|nr:hypothetical protein MUK42_16899 [Musa troglodytarum]